MCSLLDASPRLAFVGDPTHPNTARWVNHLAEVLRYDVLVFSSKLTTESDGLPYRIESLPVAGKFGYLGMGVRVRIALRRFQPDLVLAYRIQSHGFAAALTGWHPLILAAQTETIVWPPENRIFRACACFAIRRADLIQAWGSHMAARLVELGAPEDRILTLPRGVDVDTYSAARVPVRDPIIVVSRSLRAVYRHDVLIRSLAIVRQTVPDAVLRIAGDGDERESLAALAASLGLAQAVQFLGKLSERRLADEYRRARVYATTVGTEGVSASLLEAMSCGILPVVADLPGNREWLQNAVNGLLIPRPEIEDPRAVARALTQAITDDALSTRAFERNPVVIRNRANWRTNMATMDAAYRRLMRRG